jgi:hypothetical protein
MKTITSNVFVHRQTPENRFSHFDGTWAELEALAEAHLGEATPGYRDGVVLVAVPPARFYSGVVEVTPDTVLEARFGARRPDEASFVEVVALRFLGDPNSYSNTKLAAKHVEIVLYRHDVLEGDVTRDAAGQPVAQWEIISINARPTTEPEPMTPLAMARNLLALPGGTKAEYTAAEFARAIVYWSTRVMRG